MRLLTATLRIYVDAARDTGKAFARSAWALVALLVCFPLLAFTALLVSPLGIVGGFIVSLLHAALAGTYLATLADALSARRSLGPGRLRANFAAHTWDIISVLFPLWILDMLLGVARAPSLVNLVVGVAVFLFLNAIPEMIGRSRSQSLELLREAFRFMMNNGPEWLVPQVFALGVLWIALPQHALSLLQLFGPRFGFVSAGTLALSAGSGAAGWALGFGLVALVHLVMLFRGALYIRLSGGGRRGREWEERFR